MKRVLAALLMTLMLSSLALAFAFQPAKMLKWENQTYPIKKNKVASWVVYTIQTDTATYQVAKKKETKPKMQPGDAVQIEVKGDQATVINAQGKKEKYQLVGHGQ